MARRHPGDKKRDSFGKFLASYSFITGGGGRNTVFLQVGSCGTLWLAIVDCPTVFAFVLYFSFFTCGGRKAMFLQIGSYSSLVDGAGIGA